jgi:hypothetical protein
VNRCNKKQTPPWFYSLYPRAILGANTVQTAAYAFLAILLVKNALMLKKMPE